MAPEDVEEKRQRGGKNYFLTAYFLLRLLIHTQSRLTSLALLLFFSTEMCSESYNNYNQSNTLLKGCMIVAPQQSNGMGSVTGAKALSAIEFLRIVGKLKVYI
jgi:hypothetical protein